MTTNKPRLRFGIICNRPVLQEWQARCLMHLLAVEGVELALVIRKHAPPSPPPTLRHRIENQLRSWTSLWHLYNRFLANMRRSKAGRRVDVSRLLSGVPTIDCEVVTKGKYSQYFRDEDIGAIRGYELDFVLRLAPGILRGEILTAARYGIWSYHHGDMEKYRGGPACFWEIYHGDPLTCGTLQRLTERLDAGVVLYKGVFATVRESYLHNWSTVLLASAEWPARVCRDILSGNAAYLDQAPCHTVAPVFRDPSNGQVVRFAGRIMRNRLRAIWKAMFRGEQWNVGIIDRPIHTLLDATCPLTVRWLPTRTRNRFLADPFAVRRAGVTTIFAEDFDYAKNKGAISVVEADDKGFTDPRTVLALPVHLSYPCVFEWEGHVYCVPETSQAREISLYKIESLPDQWSRITTILRDIGGVDATVFQHDGRWWLLCTTTDSGTRTTLYGWHASCPTGPWIPHAANPLKTDVRSSRPAGTPFVHEGQLYRPAQDCSRTYGGAVVLNRVTRLTPTEFAETPATVITADPAWAFPHGVHTVCAAGDQTVIDGKRNIFIPAAFRRAAAAQVAAFARSNPICGMARGFFRFRWLARMLRSVPKLPKLTSRRVSPPPGMRGQSPVSGAEA
ncbi:MAG TPA: hypothetical protein PKK06_02490 [Phycisphaerae bacterium]|nr:hypothetical protein [Phycisphaerae bacterium]HNU44553.1 hypothetical protein [Phycisphaerae bacterium]